MVYYFTPDKINNKECYSFTSLSNASPGKRSEWNSTSCRDLWSLQTSITERALRCPSVSSNHVNPSLTKQPQQPFTQLQNTDAGCWAWRAKICKARSSDKEWPGPGHHTSHANYRLATTKRGWKADISKRTWLKRFWFTRMSKDEWKS